MADYPPPTVPASFTLTSSTTTIENFINGAFVPPSSEAYMDNVCPASGEVYGRVAASAPQDVDAAVAAATAAFPSWAGTSAEERSAIMLRVADLVDAEAEFLAAAESYDNGKPVALAARVDIPRLAHNFRFFATAILHQEEKSTMVEGPPGPALNYTLSSPVGVAGLISPWNLPIYLLSFKIAPCIAAGNTCVCKPSEFTSLTAYLLCDILARAGLPPGVVNMVFGDGKGAGAPLVSHPAVPLVSFTGSTATGERIAVAAAPHVKKLSLELGGKNANIVFADADLDAAVQGAVKAAFANQGQICLCGSRLFVAASIYDAFLEAFLPAVNALVVGDPRDPESNLGSLVSDVHRQKVLSYIALAQEEGGTIAAGGTALPDSVPEHLKNGFYVAPTVVTGLDASARCNMEEIFGPVVGVIPFDDSGDDAGVAAAIEAANCVAYGLSASIWTKDIKRAHNVAAALHVGTVWVNCWLVRDLRVPFGGQKHSGVGREGGEYSLEFYTEQKTVCVKL